MMEEINPYASPRSRDVEPAHPELKPEPEPEVTGAWRDGDTLLLRRKGAVLPRACVKSNRAEAVGKYVIFTCPNAWACFVIPLFLIPFVGLFVANAVMSLMAHLGPAAKVPLWFRGEVVALLTCFDLLTVGFLLGGNGLAGYALFRGSVDLFVVGLLCSALGVALVSFPFSVLGYLRLGLADPDLVRVRKVHPDYLKRLPEYHARGQAEPTGAHESGRG
jgi:hypothetical protein